MVIRIARAALTSLLGLLTVAVSVLGLPAVAQAADTGVFTLHKTLGEGDTPGTPLAGITFTLRQLGGVAVTDQQQLNELSKSDPRILANGGNYPLGEAINLVTDSNGVGIATGLPDGVYLVTEVPTRIGDVAYSVVEPFLIAIGYQGDRDIEVWAKNQAIAISLETSASEISPGEVLSVTATGTVPAPDRNGELHRYVIVVETDPLFLDPMVGRVWIASSAGDIELVEGADYTVQWDPASHQMIVSLTDLGLKKLAQARLNSPDTTVKVRLDGRAANPDGTRPESGQSTIDASRMNFRAALFVDGWSVPATAEARIRQGVSSNLQVVQVTVKPPSTTTVVPGASTPESKPPALPESLAASGGLFAGGGILAAGLICLVLFLILRRRREEDEDELELAECGSERK